MKSIIGLIAFAIVASTCNLSVAQEKTSAADRISKATAKAADRLSSKQTYKLQYKLKKGEEIRFNNVQVVSMKTRMAGEEETVSSRSETNKLWKVSSVDSLGNITFVYSLDSVKMWHKSTIIDPDGKSEEQDPVTYDSKTDKQADAPVDYQQIAGNVGKPLIVFTISPNGEIKDRKTSLDDFRFVNGDATTPMPDEAIPVGEKWSTPTTLQASDEQGRQRTLKARVAYEFAKVKDGNAYISFRTEVLTPVQSEKIRSQIMQQMTKGYLVFDIENGRPLRKEVEWDETVQGFAGDDSFLEYLAKVTEKIGAGERSAALTPLQKKVADKSVEIKTREGNPIMRK